MQCKAERAHRWRRTPWEPLVAKSVSRSLCEETTRDAPLVFHGVTVAPTGDISTGQVLPLARLFCALVCGLCPRLWWGRHGGRVRGHEKFYGFLMLCFCGRRNAILSFSFPLPPSSLQFGLALPLSLIGAIASHGDRGAELQLKPTWPGPCWS